MDFEPVRQNKSSTCSRRCNAKLQGKVRTENFVHKKCKSCGKEIKVRQTRRVFCSTRCQHNWWKEKNHYRWQGGVSIHSDGYVLIKMKEHPNADKRGWILQHRLIVEDWLQAANPASPFLENGYLKASIVVHHKNGRKSDNRLSNLQMLESQSEHMKMDNPKKLE